MKSEYPKTKQEIINLAVIHGGFNTLLKKHLIKAEAIVNPQLRTYCQISIMLYADLEKTFNNILDLPDV